MRTGLCIMFLLLCCCTRNPAENGGGDPPTYTPPPPYGGAITSYGPESFVALTPTGDEIGFSGELYPAGRRENKSVGIFYFLWQGAHGYDSPGDNTVTLLPPKASDYRSPYDISVMEVGTNNPQELKYGPQGAHHFWGKPYLDYYVGNDRWVHRKHAAMLHDAGVDVVLVDVTNGFTYINTVKDLCESFLDVRKAGNGTPQVSFIVNAGAANVVPQLYDELYSACPEFGDLWFCWEGKPLMLCPPRDYGGAINGYFTFRQSWFDAKFDIHGGWFGDGLDKWPWGDFYPQKWGHSATSEREAISVMPASHCHLNIGRCFDGTWSQGGVQPAVVTEEMSGEGRYFKQQFAHALEVDPDFILITGWNEWVAQRQVNPPGNPPAVNSFLGKPCGAGDSYFVDLYNHEYSRDLEPLADGFGDNYYYYMADYIRRYKGAVAVEAVDYNVDIRIDGEFDDWKAVGTEYTDDSGDTSERDHWGFGYKLGRLTNTTGRNDFIKAMVATDGDNISFYVETAEDITPHTDELWMRLFIGVHGAGIPDWEGFHFVVNNRVADGGNTVLMKCAGGWKWDWETVVPYAVSGNKMELSVPKNLLGITDPSGFSIDFKWIDNSVSGGDIMECMKNGDSAPNSRYRYRYVFKK